MTTIGNCFALLILAITMIVFFSIKYHITKASYYYTVCLIFTLVSAIANTIRIEVTTRFTLDPWTIKLCATADFMLMLLTTSVLALYLISKICEHCVDNENFFIPKFALAIIFLLLCIVLIANLKFGFIFYSPAPGVYKEGAIYYLPYLFIIPQISLIIICCLKHKKILTKSVKLALIESVPVVCLCILSKLLYDNISVFVLSIVLVELIFFLNFQNHRIGVNSITNLNGMRSFFQEVNTRIKKQSEFKVYFIRINNLNIVRQNYGHKAGNELLYRFAFNLEKLFPHGHTFNMHGATFTVILPCSSNKTGASESERLLNYLEEPINYVDTPLILDYVLTEYVWNGEKNADTVYEQLEHASDIAKESKLKYLNCTPELNKARLRRQYLINRIQTVSREAGFEIWFQPIFNVNKNAFSSIEALLRLKEKDGSYISPAEFIPLAESTGQIVPITWFVIEEVCRAMSSCSEIKGKKVSINLPMVQLIDPMFDKKLDRIVDRYGISHNKIIFEFTERVIIEDLDLAEKNMRRLTKSGYTFHLDDFGTGYSNFNCVLKLPIKTVKLDRSLMPTTNNQAQSNYIILILTDLFHDMGIKVIAEGAETEEQVEALRSYRVDSIQGYYFAKPMPLPELCEFLRKNRPIS